MEGETLAAMAHRHVREGKVHIDRQRVIIGRLAGNDLPTEEARHLLTLFEANQAEHQRHLDQIVEQQRNGERDENGNLVISAVPPLT